MTDDCDDAAPLPRALLEEWTVPEMPEDMKERVMAQLDEPWRMTVTPTRRPPSYIGATFIAVAALAASVGAIVIGLHRTDPPVVPAAPVEVADPVEPSRGQLTIATQPVDAVVEVDGVALPGPSPFVTTGLEVGPHEIRVHRDGHVEWSRVVDVPAAQLHLPIELRPEPVEEAILVEKMKEKPPHELQAEVKGTLDKEIIRRVVRAHLGEVRHCYNNGLVRDPNLAGKVAVQFTVGPEGKVPVSIVTGSSLADPTVATCIAKAVKGWRFPEPDGGGNVVVTYPFLLEPG